MIASRKIAAASEILRLSQSITCFFFLGLSCSWALLSLLLLASGDVFVFLEGVKKINSNTDPHSLSKWFNLIACLNIFSQPIKGQCLHRCCCPGGSALLPLPGNGSCYCQVGAFFCSHNAKVSLSWSLPELHPALERGQLKFRLVYTYVGHLGYFIPSFDEGWGKGQFLVFQMGPQKQEKIEFLVYLSN